MKKTIMNKCSIIKQCEGCSLIRRPIMWTELKTEEELSAFMRLVCCFHDSVLKELFYVSGAYVDEDLNMYPVNDKTCLHILIQRQDEAMPALELEFSGLRELRLYPTDPSYTCEILDAALFLRNGLICWCDCGDIGPDNFDDYRGTSICAKSIRWRPITEV